MDLIRVVANTQVSTVACFMKMIILSHTIATDCEVYNEATNAQTVAKRKLYLRSNAQCLTKIVVFPGRGLRLQEGCFIDWKAGEIWVGMG
ncbi:MAG: hypothetical protein E3J83_03490 [Candidatus Atribacteria bacterium]|nr:MAG: hypothetical protein E3J83_03490 [Candidatus Atribacteria bacterium]